MTFEPSLQLKTRTTPGNQEFFATRPTTSHPTDAESAEYMKSLQVLLQDEIVEIDAVEKKSQAPLQLRAESHQSTCDCWMSKLDSTPHQTRHGMGYKPSSKFVSHMIQTHASFESSILVNIFIIHWLCVAICSNSSTVQTQVVGTRRCLLCSDRGERVNKDLLSTMVSPHVKEKVVTLFNGDLADKT